MRIKLPRYKRTALICQKYIKFILCFFFAPTVPQQDNHVFLPKEHSLHLIQLDSSNRRSKYHTSEPHYDGYKKNETWMQFKQQINMHMKNAQVKRLIKFKMQ